MSNTLLNETRLLACKAFVTVLAGQTISVFGAQIAAFSLSLWIFHQTGSVIQFGMVIAAQLAPAIMLAPLAGVLIDSKNRRHIMLICDLAMMLICLPLLYWAVNQQLNISKIMCLTPLLSVFSMAHNIAYSSSISLLVPKRLYGPANAAVHLGTNLSAVVVPLLAVLILEAFGLVWILAANVLTYLLAAASLLLVEFPFHAALNTQKSRLADVFAQQLFGFRYLLKQEHSVLLRLLMFLGMVNLLNGLVQVLFRPMILTTESQMVVGVLVAIAGIGGLAGAVFSTLFINRFNKINVLCLFSYLAGGATVLCGLTTNMYAMGIIAFVFSFAIPLVLVASQTIWQLMVPVEYQGRVFAARTFLASVILMLTIVMAPLISEILLPQVLQDPSMLSGVLNKLLGAEPGRSMGLMFVISGLLVLVLTYLASMRHGMRRLRQQFAAAESDGAARSCV